MATLAPVNAGLLVAAALQSVDVSVGAQPRDTPQQRSLLPMVFVAERLPRRLHRPHVGHLPSVGIARAMGARYAAMVQEAPCMK
jgi:hypothetical protein